MSKFAYYLMKLKHLPGQHDQRAHGRTTARRSAYRSAYRKVRDSGGSVQEARTAALDASRVELQKKLDERRAERDARRAEREANRKVQPKPPTVQPESTPTVPLVDTGGPYRTMDPKEVVASVKAFAEQVNSSVDQIREDLKTMQLEQFNILANAKKIYEQEVEPAINNLSNAGVEAARTGKGWLLTIDGVDSFVADGSDPQFNNPKQWEAWRQYENARSLHQQEIARSAVRKQQLEQSIRTQLQLLKDSQKDRDQQVYDHLAVNMRHPDPYVPIIEFDDPQGKISSDGRARIVAGLNQVAQMVGRADVNFPDAPITIKYQAKGRASVSSDGPINFNTNGDIDISTIWHESFHVLQRQMPNTGIDAIPHEFAVQRVLASGEKKVQKMSTQNAKKNKQFPYAESLNYEVYEFGFYDSVDRPYTLKIRSNSRGTPFVEALTMAFTDVRDQLIDTARYQDQELFEMGIRAVQNAGKQYNVTINTSFYNRAPQAPTIQKIQSSYQYTEVQP